MTTAPLNAPPRALKVALDFLKSAAKSGRMSAPSPEVATVFAAFETEFAERYENAAISETQPTPSPEARK